MSGDWEKRLRNKSGSETQKGERRFEREGDGSRPGKARHKEDDPRKHGERRKSGERAKSRGMMKRIGRYGREKKPIKGCTNQARQSIEKCIVSF
jgi:hypothetical protein